MKFIKIMFLSLFLASCTNLKISGKVDFKNGIYISPNKVFQVDLPPVLSVNAKDSVYPTQVFVDFFTGSGYWQVEGLHTIEVLTLPKNLEPQEFQELIPKIAKEHLDLRFGKAGNFTLIESANKKDDMSHVFLAKGGLKGTPSTWICTIKKFENKIAFISLVMPLDSSSPIIKMDENTDGYYEWVNSFKIL